MTDRIVPTTRTTLRRLPERGVFDREAVNAILDAGFVCHIAFAVDEQAYAVPTGYGRQGNVLYVHGSAASRMLRTLERGGDVCVTVTLIDGFVLARSAFHHSMNYRSVMVLGRARLVTEPGEKMDALRVITNHIVPGRWEEVRLPTEQELKGTTVLALPIEEASAKVRTGPPRDDEEDKAFPVWAGVVPISIVVGQGMPDADLLAGVTPFDVTRLSRTARSSTPAGQPPGRRG